MMNALQNTAFSCDSHRAMYEGGLYGFIDGDNIQWQSPNFENIFNIDYVFIISNI